jgi:hypothetical protein
MFPLNAAMRQWPRTLTVFCTNRAVNNHPEFGGGSNSLNRLWSRRELRDDEEQDVVLAELGEELGAVESMLKCAEPKGSCGAIRIGLVDPYQFGNSPAEFNNKMQATQWRLKQPCRARRLGLCQL